MLVRPPCPALRPFVVKLWASEETGPRGGREQVLPTGGMHLVFRFSAPLRIFDDVHDPVGRTIGHAIIGGARASSYVRDTSHRVTSVGAQLAPGASTVLLATPAVLLAERHTPLEDLWGGAAREMLERLEEAGGAERRLDLLEAMLVARCPRVRGVHPAVARALAGLAQGALVGQVAAAAGYSHRGFAAMFEREVGLAPKRFCRVRRLQGVLAAAARGAAWAAIAVDCGYADQSHLHRDLRDLAGMTPVAYRRAAPRWTHHVPLR